jgi:hypothetical protein
MRKVKVRKYIYGERGKISHANKNPTTARKFILARVVPKKVEKKITNSDAVSVIL